MPVVRRGKKMVITGGYKLRRKGVPKTVQLQKQINKLKRRSAEETKVLYTTGSIANVDYDGSITELSTIPQGDTAYTRDGKSVKTLNLTFKAYAQSAASGVVRVIIFKGKSENNRTFVPGDILQTTGQVHSVLTTKDDSERYNTKILMDKTLVVTPSAGSIDGYRLMFKSIKLGHYVTYAASDTAGTDIEDGGLYMLVIGNITSVSGTKPTVAYQTKLTFVG